MKKQEKFNALLRNLASTFITREIGRGVLVTVMRVETPKDLHLAKIFISVFPENKEKEILQLLKEESREFYDSLKKQLRIKFLPAVSFEIDRATKLEREIEEVLKK